MQAQQLRFVGQDIHTYIDVEVRDNNHTILLPQLHPSKRKRIQIVDAYWELTVPKENVDPWDPMNYVIKYPNLNDKLNPIYMASRNTLEGFHRWSFQGIVISLSGQGSYNSDGMKNDVICRLFKNENNLKGLSIKLDQNTNSNIIELAHNITSITLKSESIWEFQTQGFVPLQGGLMYYLPQTFQKGLFQNMTGGNPPETGTIELPITHEIVSVGINNYQPNWNRVLYLRLKILYI